MTNASNNYRKPNYKKWICPIDGESVNSRGAAPYLRIKYGIPWDSRYLNKPELLKGLSLKYFDKVLFAQISSIVSKMDFGDDEIKDKVQNSMYRLFGEIRNNANNKSRIDKILRDIESITPSGFNFDE